MAPNGANISMTDHTKNGSEAWFPCLMQLLLGQIMLVREDKCGAVNDDIQAMLIIMVLKMIMTILIINMGKRPICLPASPVFDTVPNNEFSKWHFFPTKSPDLLSATNPCSNRRTRLRFKVRNKNSFCKKKRSSSVISYFVKNVNCFFVPFYCF